MIKRRFDGTMRYIKAHWPAFLLAYGGMIVSLLAIAVGLDKGWFALAPIAAAAAIVLGYGVAAAAWSAHRLYDPDGLLPHLVLFDMANIRSTDSVAYLDFGLRQRAAEIAARLTKGKVTVIDVYNPQLTPGRPLYRLRTMSTATIKDPRLEWLNGSIDMLPMPDNSAPAVFLCQVLSEFWQRGDRSALLKEVRRILEPGGFALIAEPSRSQANWLTKGPAAAGIPTVQEWRKLFSDCGFDLLKERELHGLIHCAQIVKSKPADRGQLRFDL